MPNGATFQNHPTLPIAIVGGGLGGLALAIGLLKHHVNVHIYEAAPAFSQIGAGVTFGYNSTRALGLIDERLLEGYRKHATFNEDPEGYNTFMSFRWGMDEQREGGKMAGDMMFNLDDKWDSEAARSIGVRTRSCIHRARLLEEMVALLPPDIATFSKSFESVLEHADGTLELRFTDGTTALACAAIGCDGVRSKMRDIICGPGADATYVGEYAYRAMVPAAEVEGVLGREYARNGQLYCGYGSYIVTYPVEDYAFTNMVAVHHEPITSPYSWKESDWTVPATSDEFAKHFEGWHGPLKELVKNNCQPLKWALFNIRHSRPYYKGKLSLLGDSAHAATPHLGAGAGMAMEDAYLLANLISAVHSADAIESAFRAYDAVRRPRTQKVVEYSRLAGLACDFMLPEYDDNVEKLRDRFEEWYQWIWHEDLPEELEAAKKLL
ncbi:mannitol 1-phosphate dehydrogenase [Lophiotrema nucula]|uniref:Mannitol 1-phosphate dehydrogenase n=1 Tax=Lophiotrema nucula TaxID=690887 RepID=A0A6A5Z8W9_9PLEO|nr:mannitol 1-phosphate dehydrogenase [Lophiotrema nucula]